MAYDKVIDSAQFEADLTAVADAIREKGDTTALLAWPEEYIAAIEDMETGASDAKIYVTCMAPGDVATATLDGQTATATAGEDGIAVISVAAVGTWKCRVNGYYWGTAYVSWPGDEIQRPIPRFGYRKTMADSNPATRITYLYDAEGLSPAKMDFANGVFDYGDWADFVAVKGNYPVMLRYDGTEDYKLNPDNYAYKEDGITPSDVSDTAYEGNAMSVHPRMWVHRYQDDTYQYCIFCPIQWDENYRADAFVNHDGWLGDRMYMPCFKGALVDGKLRSIMGLAPQSNSTATQEVGYAAANNPEGKTLWTIIPWSRRAYINDLLVLLGRSTDTQAVYGQGSVVRSTAASGICQTGTLAARGQFFGYSTTKTKTQVKVLHMEGVWGDRWDRAVGLVNNNGKILVKMAPPYSLTDFAGYVDAGITPGGTSGGYISATVMSDLGNIPQTASGSATTYEADALWFNNSIVAIPLVGCDCNTSNAAGLSGAFALAVNRAASYAHWSIGASPSCDQPTPEGVTV